MRELTMDEVDAVSGGGWFSNFFSSVGDFLGFDGQFGYQGGGGSLSFGNFLGALGDLSSLSFLLPEGISIGLGHDEGTESEARRTGEELFGQMMSLPAQGAAGQAAQAAGTQYAHSSVDLFDFFGQFMVGGFTDLNNAVTQGYPLSNGIPSREVILSDPHYSLTNPPIGGGEQ